MTGCVRVQHVTWGGVCVRAHHGGLGGTLGAACPSEAPVDPEAVRCCTRTSRPVRPAAPTLLCPWLAVRAVQASLSTCRKGGTQLLPQGIPAGASGSGWNILGTVPTVGVGGRTCAGLALFRAGQSATVSMDGEKARVAPAPFLALHLSPSVPPVAQPPLGHGQGTEVSRGAGWDSSQGAIWL